MFTGGTRLPLLGGEKPSAGLGASRAAAAQTAAALPPAAPQAQQLPGQRPSGSVLQRRPAHPEAPPPRGPGSVSRGKAGRERREEPKAAGPAGGAQLLFPSSVPRPRRGCISERLQTGAKRDGKRAKAEEVGENRGAGKAHLKPSAGRDGVKAFPCGNSGGAAGSELAGMALFWSAERGRVSGAERLRSAERGGSLRGTAGSPGGAPLICCSLVF